MSKNKVYKPTDYAKGTVMEPEHISSLRASFGEYEALGNRHRDLTNQIDSLREKMKLSRQRGAFQTLQDQMREVKDLVKQREDIDARMSVADLARKKEDDRRVAASQESSYSEKLDLVRDRIANLETMMLSYAEQEEAEFDFARCQRPDGSFYGTRGKCRKGSEAGETPAKKPAAGRKKRATPAELKETAEKLYQLAKILRGKEKEAVKVMKTVKKETKGDNSVESRRKRILAEQAATKAMNQADRAEAAFLKANSAFVKAHEKEQRKKMTPAQRAETLRIDRIIKERG